MNAYGNKANTQKTTHTEQRVRAWLQENDCVVVIVDRDGTHIEHGPRGARRAILERMAERGELTVEQHNGKVLRPAGPFGSTRYGWKAIRWVERIYRKA